MPATTKSSLTGDRAARDVETPGLLTTLENWTLVRPIGQGLLANVYQARPVQSASTAAADYAVKVLRRQWQDDACGLTSFAREVQVSREVRSPRLAPILSANLQHRPYHLVMPLLTGQTVAGLLRARGQLDPPVALWVARQAAEGLAALHAQGWLHADIKPSNLFCSPEGHVTLIDLGFARRSQERSSIAERPVLGTLHYLAPEVLYSALGGDIRGDIYSLGVTLFEMLTGRVPFDADDIAELASQHRQGLPSDVRSFVPHVPTRAARLVHQMLAKEPLRRPLPDELIDRLTRLEIETFADRAA